MISTTLEPNYLARVITDQTGLGFEAKSDVDADGQLRYLLRPRDLPAEHTFCIQTTLGWRRLRVDFEPGKFAVSLLADMGHADADARSVFRSVLADCVDCGAEIHLEINGKTAPFDSDDVWAQKWSGLVLTLKKGQLELGTDDGEPDAQIACRWTGRHAAAIVAILPTESESVMVDPDVVGYPEGALATVQINRFERDRRNRAAAIAIHGSTCKGCGLEMAAKYGSLASGVIEVHHITPVSELGDSHVIDPATDLVPLCPNCHTVVHRRSPPISIEDLKELIWGSRDKI